MRTKADCVSNKKRKKRYPKNEKPGGTVRIRLSFGEQQSTGFIQSTHLYNHTMNNLMMRDGWNKAKGENETPRDSSDDKQRFLIACVLWQDFCSAGSWNP